MKKKVDVSILTTNYNNGKFLSDFFDSIINSTVSAKEIIFVDDGSTDNSIEIVKEKLLLLDLYIIDFVENKGRAAALNAGKSKCRSKYILIIDPDDILLPERIETQYNFMENNPDVDILGGNVIYFNSKTGQKLNISNFPTSNSDIYKTFYRGENGVLQPTVICKTEVIKKYDYKQIVPGQDYELFARLAKDGYKFAGLKEPLNRMRIHTNSVVSNVKLESFTNLFFYRDKIFGTKTSKIKIRFYYWHIKYYRKSMFAKKPISKYFNLFLSILAYPQKIIKRLLK